MGCVVLPDWSLREQRLRESRAVDRIGRGGRRDEPRRVNVIGAIPGLLEQFAKQVPDSYVDGDWLTCVCGGRTELVRSRIVDCTGGCGRYFLRGNESVGCAGPYPVEEAA